MVFARVAEYLTGAQSIPSINDAGAREGTNIMDTRRQAEVMESAALEQDSDAERPAYPHVR